jgi:hypothetical protein
VLAGNADLRGSRNDSIARLGFLSSFGNIEEFMKIRKSDDSKSLMQHFEEALTPQPVTLVVDYFNVSDMRFTAEFEVLYTYAFDEGHTRFIRRYFNPASRKVSRG